jgi:alanine racemase
MLHLGFTGPEIQEGIRNLKPISMRLEFKEGINDCYLIDDCYSNDINGLAQALDFMQRQQAFASNASKTVILSDILESGKTPIQLYADVEQLLSRQNISRLIVIGPEVFKYQGLFNNGKFNKFSAYLTTKDFLEDPEADQFSGELILVKGARAFKFEQVIAHLQAKVHGTRLEINLDAIAHNLSEYRALLSPNTKVMVMVKAFAYGSGSYEIANFLQHQGIHYLAVAYTDEGVLLRQNCITLPIMVMNPGEESFEKLADYRLEPVVYSTQELKLLLRFLKGTTQESKIKESHKIGIHLELETGMNRLGIDQNRLPDVLVELLSNENLVTVKGVFSHLAAADEADMDQFSRLQIDAFAQMEKIVTATLGYQPMRHLLNSPGITAYPEAQFDMVRLGIGLYGFDPNNLIQHKLRPVSKLISTISQIKTVGPDDTVGYSRKGRVARETKIATISIGYADGFDRRFSNGKGFVRINGYNAPIIGNVCMDMAMVNLGNIPAKEGDEVYVFDNERTIAQLAQELGTIPYEILTKVSQRVKRIFYTEQS